MRADVCFLLEGTYPYVAGGVSTWVDQTIRANPHLRFAIVNLVANESAAGEFKYRIPENVATLRTAYLHDADPRSEGPAYDSPRLWDLARDLYARLPEVDYGIFEDLVREIARGDWRVDAKSLLFSRRSWDLLVEFYGDKDVSFNDFFWTWRFTHLPLLSVLRVDAPPAAVYHCASTGYAGLLGCLARIRHGGRLLLTEHGLYAKERKIEISNSNWVYDERKEGYRVSRNMGFFRQWWITMFLALSKLAYQGADRVTTLFKGNFDMQVEHGCPPGKLSIIPNGIDVEGYRGVAAKTAGREEGGTFAIGFVGRVTPIKDVKTFIRAMKVVTELRKDVKVYVMGPTEEDEAYVAECRVLVDLFDLAGVVEFTGRVQVKDYYPRLDLVVLTSVSEGLPFVVLEAHASGLPCVCSDVGACRELLTGLTEEDRALGPSGIVTHVSSPDETAAAILRLASDRALWRRMREAALRRVDRFYRLEDVNARYTRLYHELMHT